jgi:hypothetical protein
MKNNHGTTFVAPLFVTFIAFNFFVTFNQTDNFRIRKGIEKCVTDGMSPAACKLVIDRMSSSEVKDYIRDDEVPNCVQWKGCD